MTKHAHLVHVGPYKFLNMVRSRHIGAKYNAATLTYTRATMQYFVQTLTDYLRFDNKIGMDANNLKSVLVQAMAWGGRQQAIAWVTVDEYNNILYKAPLAGSGFYQNHYHDVIMSAMASQITGVSIICLTVCWGAGQRKSQSSTSLVPVRGDPPVSGGPHSQRASDAENIRVWWRHHVQRN